MTSIPKEDERTPGPEYWKTREGAAFNAIGELCNPDASMQERIDAADILRAAIGMPTAHAYDCGIRELDEFDASDCTCDYWTEPRIVPGSFTSLREALALIAGGFEGEGLEIENEWRRSVSEITKLTSQLDAARAELNHALDCIEGDSDWSPETWARLRRARASVKEQTGTGKNFSEKVKQVSNSDERPENASTTAHELDEARAKAIEEAITIAKAALELPGLPPERFWEEVASDPLETCRAIVRATKTEIIDGLTALLHGSTK